MDGIKSPERNSLATWVAAITFAIALIGCQPEATAAPTSQPLPPSVPLEAPQSPERAKIIYHTQEITNPAAKQKILAKFNLEYQNPTLLNISDGDSYAGNLAISQTENGTTQVMWLKQSRRNQDKGISAPLYPSSKEGKITWSTSPNNDNLSVLTLKDGPVDVITDRYLVAFNVPIYGPDMKPAITFNEPAYLDIKPEIYRALKQIKPTQIAESTIQPNQTITDTIVVSPTDEMEIPLELH